MKTPFTLLFCFALLSPTFADYHIDGTESVLSFEKAGKMILIPGQVGDVNGYFLLDTGAPGLILNRRFFGHLKRGRTAFVQDTPPGAQRPYRML